MSVSTRMSELTLSYGRDDLFAKNQKSLKPIKSQRADFKDAVVVLPSMWLFVGAVISKAVVLTHYVATDAKSFW